MVKFNQLKSKRRGHGAIRSVYLVLGVLSVYFFGNISCSETPASVKPGEKLYFDLKGYFNQEVQRLASFPKAKKIATVDGKQEERMLDSLNFQEELKIFSGTDINRAAWSDKYAIDSVFNEQRQLIQLNYTANDKDLRTQNISIDFEENAVSEIFIENSSSSTVADTKQLLTYRPGEGYTIESHQKVSFTEGNTFLVEVQFLKN